MIEDLLLPFQVAFLQRAFLVGLIVAVPMALLSCFLVLKGWALMGDAISHAILPGVVLAYVAGAPLILGAFIAGMGTALATGYLSDNSRVKQDTVMGVVFSGMFALGIVLYTALPSELHLDHILFGNILGTSKSDLWQALSFALPITLILILKWKDFMLYAFDPAQARVSGLGVSALHYGLLTLLSLGIITTMTATGLILAIGLLIAPGAIAFLLTRRFGRMLWIAVGAALSAMLFGIYASVFLDSAPAPTVMLVLTLYFIAAFVTKEIRTARAQRL